MKKKERDSRMELREDGGVPYFIFKNLEETGLVRHGFSTHLTTEDYYNSVIEEHKIYQIHTGVIHEHHDNH